MCTEDSARATATRYSKSWCAANGIGLRRGARPPPGSGPGEPARIGALSRGGGGPFAVLGGGLVPALGVSPTASPLAPSARPFLNSDCAEPSDLASLGICVLPNRTAITTTRTMTPSIPKISASIGCTDPSLLRIPPVSGSLPHRLDPTAPGRHRDDSPARPDHPARNTPMTRAAIDDSAVTPPHTARPRGVVERVWSRAASPANATTTILIPEHDLPGVGLAAVHGRDVPQAGDHEHRVGGPLDAGEGDGPGSLAAPSPRLRAAGDQPGQGELAAHPHRGGQHVEREPDPVEGGGEAAAAHQAHARPATCPANWACASRRRRRGPPWRRPTRTPPPPPRR